MKKLLVVMSGLIISMVSFAQTPSNGTPRSTNNTGIIPDTTKPVTPSGNLPNSTPGSIPGTLPLGTTPNNTPGSMPGTLPAGTTPSPNNVPSTTPGHPGNPPGTPATPGVTNPPSR